MVNETLLNSRASSSSSSICSTVNRDSTLDRLSRSQFLNPQSRSCRASASATRDIASSQSTRAAYLSDSRDSSFNLSRGTALRGHSINVVPQAPVRGFIHRIEACYPVCRYTEGGSPNGPHARRSRSRPASFFVPMGPDGRRTTEQPVSGLDLG